MRPQKTRWVTCASSARYFKPVASGKPRQEIVLSLDEFEALRLLDYEKLSQEQAALSMRVHRSTISRIATKARMKIVTALVQMQPLRIRGGCCKSKKERE